MLLARRGVDVLQVVPSSIGAQRPHEILCPSTRRFLAQYGLTEPLRGKSECRGVLACWSSNKFDFHDYPLTACAPALVVERVAFHNSLVTSARDAGVRILPNARLRNRQMPWASGTNIKITVGNSSYSVSARWVIDATGRQGGLHLPPTICRTHLDRLVAFSVPVEGQEYSDCLILEAVADGWWYASPEVAGQTHLVFLTDSDLVPWGVEARREWIVQRYQRTKCVSTIATSSPTFLNLVGTDARFSSLTSTVYERWVAVGDRALALDPLSGNGVSLTLTAAEYLASEFCESSGPILDNYKEWCRQNLEREQSIRCDVYSRASARFPHTEFWRRRQSVA